MNQNLIPGLLLAGTLCLGYLYWVGDTPSNHGSLRPNPGQDAIQYNRVQQYAKEQEVRRDIYEKQAQFNKIKKRELLDPNFRKEETFHESNPQESLGPAARDLSQDKGYKALTLDQRMDAFLAQRHRYEALEKAKKERYVQEFIKEARGMGFHVEVNDDMEIIDVREIR